MANDFLDDVADALIGLPSVDAVALGGSRAENMHKTDSDWDLAIYYRGHFDPEHLRGLGWEGEVFDTEAWGGGVFNGGAWLRINGHAVDVHYRDRDVVEQQHARAERGEFHIEPLMFHLAGIPSYLVVGELAINRVLRGSLPSPEFPEALRRAAPRVWADRAELHLKYAEHNHAPQGRATQCAGLLAVAASEYAHAVLAARGEWITNEKRLFVRAGMHTVDDIITGLAADPGSLSTAVTALRRIGEASLNEADQRGNGASG